MSTRHLAARALGRALSALAPILVAAALFGAWSPCGAAAAPAAAPPRTAASAPAAPPGAATLPGYLGQTNGERARVQPGNNAPMWRAIKRQAGFTSLPYPEAGVLIQPQTRYPGSAYTSAGEAWRQSRNGLLVPVGGWLLLIALIAIAGFYFIRGRIRLERKPTGRKIERFTPFERFLHWALAFSFLALMLSGVVIMFGKFFLLPILGGAFFGWLAYALKTVHNFVGPIFAIALLFVILTFVRDNLPNRQDLTWLATGGGLFGGREVASARFNAGEKLWFWIGVLVLGAIAAGSGLVLDKLVPGVAYTRGVMQVAEIFHATAAVLLISMAFGHIYIGSIGTEGALDGMRTGYVDESWAHQHHALWLEDIQSGKIPAQRSGAGVQAPIAVTKPKV